MNLSIIIPHYEKNDALSETWKELMLQIDPDDQILIVDDHSKVTPVFDCPCTETIQPPKQSPHIYRLCTLRNYGLEHAKHDTCIILDPDCLPNPKFIEHARKMSDASVLFGGCVDWVGEEGIIKKDSRRKQDKSYWCDLRDKKGSQIWGGVMMFSKSRTALIGWFDEDFNNGWGAEEHEFASRCYHSGMRLRYSMELKVEHQWHIRNIDGYQENRKKWGNKTMFHGEHLNNVSPYKPVVGVMVITMMRPDLIDQCLQSLFRNRIPLKVRLINNGDDGEETRKICKQWGRRWAVDYVYHPRKWPAQIRNDSLKWGKENNFKYMLFIDDDVTVINNGVRKLFNAMEYNPSIYAMSGKIIQLNEQTRLLGGPLRDRMFYRYTDRVGVHDSDWVGGGFTIHRLNPLILYDDGYETGFNDYDWSMTAKAAGYRLAVNGDAEAWHKVKLTNKGVKRYKNNAKYRQIRYDNERHNRMRKRFEDKWGFWLEGGGFTDK